MNQIVFEIDQEYIMNYAMLIVKKILIFFIWKSFTAQLMGKAKIALCKYVCMYILLCAHHNAK